MNTPGNTAPATATGRRKSRGGLELLSLMALAVILVNAVTSIVRAIISHELTVSLELPDQAEGLIPGLPARADGLMSFIIPFDELSAWAITHVLIAQIILVAGTLVAGWYLSRVISIIAEGKPLSQRASRFLSIAFWAAFGTGLAVGLNLMLGGNLVTRDLGIAEAGFTNGVTTMGSFVWLGVLGLIQVFRLALQRGQRAEDELEGVI
ncbi:hypothetical protein [Brevibacterium luteolum]|uniref:hypothetical protein n=1 Tax=Brevibacterium luteolum TaxID=199591 RepID=UPI00223AF146|nr:hypothetical protein [Brevibacterium luteolum]MCT1828689.1 hypothetical protein [Brevibacterium luteolum]